MPLNFHFFEFEFESVVYCNRLARLDFRLDEVHISKGFFSKSKNPLYTLLQLNIKFTIHIHTLLPITPVPYHKQGRQRQRPPSNKLKGRTSI
jgi:hypothetical protein